MLATLAAAVIGGAYLLITGMVDLEVTGVEEGARFGEAVPAAVVSVRGPLVGEPRATINGEELDFTGGELVFDDLASGTHSLHVSVDRIAPWPDATVVRTFVVDREPPVITIIEPNEPVAVNSPVTIKGTVSEAATLTVDGTDVPVAADDTFENAFDETPRGVLLEAVDEVGNRASTPVPIVLALPGAPGQEPIRGVHATGYTWVTPSLRDPIVEMVDEGLINTVQLDLKDESGMVWYDTGVELAHEIGAVEELFDLREVVQDLHGRGVRVIGRIVNFRDPVLAEYAIAANELDMLVLTPGGEPYAQYGGFTNPYNEVVREYSIALAEEAASLGVDDILYDYVRRPDAPLEAMRFPGQDRSPEDAIVDFLAESHERVTAHGSRLGASVFGIAATRPLEIAQDIPRMSDHVDYVAPMVYPSHWAPGEYGVDNPNRQPYDIVYRSLVDFQTAVDGTDATVIAWLQDFSLGVTYGPSEVRAQIEATYEAGIDEFLLWDPSATYTVDALAGLTGR